MVLVPSGRAASVARAVRASAGGRHGDRGARGGLRVHPGPPSAGYPVAQPHAERDALADADPNAIAEPERIGRTVRDDLREPIREPEPEPEPGDVTDAEAERLPEDQPDRPTVALAGTDPFAVSEPDTLAYVESTADAGSLRKLIRPSRLGAASAQSLVTLTRHTGGTHGPGVDDQIQHADPRTDPTLMAVPPDLDPSYHPRHG